MTELERQAVLLRLIAALNEADSWTGETHVQKCSYVLEEGLNVPLDLSFILYKHGPYSFDLADLIGELRGKLLVSLRMQPDPYGPSLRVSGSGDSFTARFPRVITEYADKITFVARRLGSKNVKELERIATALYVTNNYRGGHNKRAEKLVELKPHVNLPDAQAAVSALDELLSEAPR